VGDVDTGPFATVFRADRARYDEWPFVVTLNDNGVWAIRRTGEPAARGGRYRGHRTQRRRQSIPHQVGECSLDPTLDGTLTKLADLPGSGAWTGWLTSNGNAYLVQRGADHRKVYVVNGASVAVIASAPPASPPTSEDPVPLRVFAIPTRDYDGAWILERAPGQPTTLSRHTPSGGMETMWSDETGPQVEALIAGASGQTVLLQVHRERESAELAKPFIDPALAVWRIGQPAPRAYDELYLNEEWNKGFVIVDADRIESGDTFVFNSGFKEIPYR
jgi:hypothetical protein